MRQSIFLMYAPGVAELKDYVGNVEAFPILRNWDFFNHAGVAPLPRAASQAFEKYAAEAQSQAYLNTSWFADIEVLRKSAATLMNATHREIAFIKNTSEGISIIANGIDWQWGDVIVTTAVEYPANIYPWMDVARAHGAKLVMVPEEDSPDGARIVPIEKILKAADDPRCRLVALSHVEYASGQRHDLMRIGQFCRENHKLLAVDAIQTLGIIPIDVRAMNIDYLSADGHKWLLGPEGAGVFYCRQELIERTRPLMIGWMNVIDNQNFGHYDFTLKSDAGRFECGSYNVPGLLALKPSLEMLLQLGTEHIANRLHHLGDHLIAGLVAKGYKIVSPRGLGQWGGAVSFTSPAHDHGEIFRKLRKDHQTEIALREGRLRVSPHFYNTEAQLDRLIEHLPLH